MRKRDKSVLVWLTEEELSSVKGKAEKCGLSLQEYLRSLIENVQPKELPPMDFYEVLRELRQLNINMNQIALKAHTLNLIDAPFYSECHQDLQDTVDKIMGILYE